MQENKLKEIFQRRCVRDFDSSKRVTKKELKLIMRAGQAAPSVKNRQPYYFVTIINKECRKEIYLAADKGRRKQFAHLTNDELEEKATGDIGSNDKIIYEASAAILVFRASDPKYSEAKNQSENLNIKEEQSVANAAYSMMIQAEYMGLSTGWICSPLYIEREIKEILLKYGVECKENWKPRVILPIGYCKKKGKKIERESLESKSSIIE
jgi:nitroreductase